MKILRKVLKKALQKNNEWKNKNENKKRKLEKTMKTKHHKEFNNHHIMKLNFKLNAKKYKISNT